MYSYSLSRNLYKKFRILSKCDYSTRFVLLKVYHLLLSLLKLLQNNVLYVYISKIQNVNVYEYCMFTYSNVNTGMYV